MTNFSASTVSIYLIFGVIFFLLLGLVLIFNYLTQQTIAKKKMEFANNAACRKAQKEHEWRLLTEYFWSDSMRFAWIMLFLLFFIILGFAFSYALNTLWTMLISLIAIIITVYFLLFARKSYKAFPAKAAERLEKFEKEVLTSLENEISFKGDNIQIFSKDDDSFDTDPKIFSFATNIKKIQFPPFQTNAKKQPIIHTRKLEFLILSREYFSICKNAATFNLLDPARAPAFKQCAEVPGRGGECHEHYYSQMRNVEYDGEKECIRIIYYDERDDVEFSCNKMNPNRKPAIKALQEKLRLTERQRLHKIDEHEKYEEIKSRRKDNKNDENTEED